MQRVTSLRTDHPEWTPTSLLEHWRQYLHEQDRSPGTVKKYVQAVSHFLAWYEREERVPLQLATLTPIALISYRNELQQQGVRPLDVFAHVEPDKAYREPERADDAHLVTAEQRCLRARRAGSDRDCTADHERDAVRRTPSLVLV
jgi:Phage integrase, N-terminal SAM-like domain